MIIAVTGATAGIGLAATRLLVKRGDTVLMACRNQQKAEQKRDEIAKELGLSEEKGHEVMKIVALDQGNFDSVRRAAEQMKTLGIQKLYNNAGAMFSEWGLSADGYERNIATNCMGPVLLAESLMDCETLDTVLYTVSVSCKVAKIDQTAFLNTEQPKYTRLSNYSTSKLALFLYIARQCELDHTNKRIVALDPGVVNTNMITQERWFDSLADIFFRPFIRKPETAAAIGIRALDDREDHKLYRGKKTYSFPGFIVDHPLKTWVYETVHHVQNVKPEA